MAQESIPLKLCIPLPNPKPLKVTLPFGMELKSLIDPSKGPPSDCTLVHGLMLQLAPALGGLECILKMLNVFAKLANVKTPMDILDVAKAAGELSKCFAFVANIVCFVVDVLKLIIAYLKCLISAVLSVLEFKAGIDLSGAGGNPLLSSTLTCAQGNAEASLSQLREALAVIQPLLAIVKSIGEMAGSLPGPVQDGFKTINDALSALQTALGSGGASVGVPGVQDLVATLEQVKTTLDELEQLLDAVPC